MTWADVENRWPGRLELLAGLLPESAATVLDLGAGSEGLRDLLPAGTVYIPVDRVRRSPETVVADLDVESPPPGDVAVAAGLLEYLAEVPGFLRRVREVVPVLVFTYHRPRTSSTGWSRVLSGRELRRACRQAGWSRVVVVGRWEGSVVWRCER